MVFVEMCLTAKNADTLTCLPTLSRFPAVLRIQPAPAVGLPHTYLCFSSCSQRGSFFSTVSLLTTPVVGRAQRAHSTAGVINTMAQSNLEKKGSVSSHNSQVTIHHQGKSGEELEAGNEVGTMEELYLLPCSASFLIHPRKPAQGWHCP